MRSATMFLSILLVTSACTKIQEASWRLQNSAKGSIIKTSDAMRDWVAYTPKADDPRLPQQRFCYDAYSDIICYEHPQPHLTNRLVGYQGTAHHYATAAPTEPVGIAEMSHALPADQRIEVSENDEAGEPRSLMIKY